MHTIYAAIKRNASLRGAMTWMNLCNILLINEKSHKRSHIIQANLCEMPRICKFIETEVD